MTVTYTEEAIADIVEAMRIVRIKAVPPDRVYGRSLSDCASLSPTGAAMSIAHRYLTRREAELLDILYRRGPATAVEILKECEESRNYSTVRTQLRVLEQKGHVKRKVSGGRRVYSPKVPTTLARGRAFRHLLDTFFDGSLENAVIFALTSKSFPLSDDARDRLITLCMTRKITKPAGPRQHPTAISGRP